VIEAKGEPEREHPDFDDEDLAIVDSVWDAIAQEEEADDEDQQPA
jgi:hypothetical protein